MKKMFQEEERRLKYLHWILWYGGHCDLVRAISGNWWRQKLDQGRMKNAEYVRNQRLWELSALENFVYKGKEQHRGCWGVGAMSFPETIYLKAICGLQNLRKCWTSRINSFQVMPIVMDGMCLHKFMCWNPNTPCDCIGSGIFRYDRWGREMGLRPSE